MRLALLAMLLPLALLQGREVRVKLHRGDVIRLSLEDYVAGVLTGEASTFVSEEGRKAMAVAARTWAVYHLGRHKAEGYDFCESTHCQDFRMRGGVPDAVRAAVEATEAELLWYQGRPAAAYYARHCGGQSAAGSEIWPGLWAPYLRSTPDTFCLARGRAEWSRAIDEPVRIVARSPSGRVLQVQAGSRRIAGDRFPSNLFEVTGRQLRGYGSGHGVGLCQIGADERGKAGQKYDAILAAYYPGTVTAIAAGGLRWRTGHGERVDVFASSEGELREAAAAADRAFAEAGRRSGLRIAGRPRVRVYPSVPVYRDATGDNGSVAATTSGMLVRLQPLAILRSRGALHPTLLHEMLHVLIEGNARPDVPVWFREGLAQVLGGSSRSPRVSALARQYGIPVLTGWLQTGVPQSAARSGQTQ